MGNDSLRLVVEVILTINPPTKGDMVSDDSGLNQCLPGKGVMGW